MKKYTSSIIGASIFWAFGLGAIFAGPLKFWSLYHLNDLAWMFFSAGAVFLALDILLTLRGAAPGKFYELRPLTSRFAWFLIPFAALCGGLLLYGFRMGRFALPPEGLGDSLLLIQNVPVFSRIFGFLDSPDELLQLFLHSRLYIYGNDVYGLLVEEVYALVSSAAGGALILLVLLFLRKRSLREIMLGLSLLLFTPALQLFAGYMENYHLSTLYMAGLLLYCAYYLEKLPEPGERSSRNDMLFLALVGLLAGWTALHHLVTGAIFPALAYLVSVFARKGDWKSYIQKAMIPGLTGILIIAAVWIYFLFLRDTPMTLGDSHVGNPPIYPPSRFISVKHFRDFLNQILISAPLAFVFILLHSGGAFSRSQGTFFKRLLQVFAPTQTTFFLLLATLSQLFVSFIAHPLLDFPADWDAFTMFQFPLNLYAFFLVKDSPILRTDKSPLRIPAMLLLAGILTCGWIGFNHVRNQESEVNLQDTHQAVGDFLELHNSDQLFGRITNPARRKLYVRVNLFLFRSNRKLAKMHSPQALELRQALVQAKAEFYKLVLVDDAAFAKGLPVLWKELTRINVTLSKM